MLQRIIIEALKNNATSRTRKYFINRDVDPKKEYAPGETYFEKRAAAIADTIKYIATLKSSSFICDGEVMNICDYYVPENFNQLIKAGRVYFNSDAREADVAMFQVNVGTDLEILSDREFNKFFNDFNENQQEKVGLVPMVKPEGCLISELENAKTSDDVTVKLGGSVIAGEAAALMEVQLPMPSRLFATTVHYTEKELEKWLM